MTNTNAHTSSLTALALAAALALGACSSMPADNAALVSARAAFDAAQNDAQTRELAATELASANAALNRANEAFKRGDSLSEVDHLAYLANQRVAVARQTAKQKMADKQVLSAEAERDRTRLAARTNEAEAATAQAQRSQQEAQAAQRAAAASQLDAQAAQRTAQTSREQSEAARQQSETAVRVAQAAQMKTAEAQARAAQLEAQMRTLNAKKTERGMVVTIGDVLFDTGRAELKSGSTRDMNKLADFFKTYPERTALVEGFTDSVGGLAANQELSNRRADAVRAALVDMGVARDRINARGYGEAFPVAGNDSASGRQMNRRVEIVLSDDSGQIKPR
jgi:outer membrane protein OmpA-like peptidoglycan-associated protein